jgi:hypothetical protein
MRAELELHKSVGEHVLIRVDTGGKVPLPAALFAECLVASSVRKID